MLANSSTDTSLNAYAITLLILQRCNVILAVVRDVDCVHVYAGTRINELDKGGGAYDVICEMNTHASWGSI